MPLICRGFKSVAAFGIVLKPLDSVWATEAAAEPRRAETKFGKTCSGKHKKSQFLVTVLGAVFSL
ncbi:MAG: hypothetical protein CFE23_02070 [Flavobacterium sp. BFFFF1]|nr:MAG: hypothetical protein CFE23_02070 [Flavobacterium sp. BFFFF1]